MLLSAYLQENENILFQDLIFSSCREIVVSCDARHSLIYLFHSAFEVLLLLG